MARFLFLWLPAGRGAAAGRLEGAAVAVAPLQHSGRGRAAGQAQPKQIPKFKIIFSAFESIYVMLLLQAVAHQPPL